MHWTERGHGRSQVAGRHGAGRHACAPLCFWLESLGGGDCWCFDCWLCCCLRCSSCRSLHIVSAAVSCCFCLACSCCCSCCSLCTRFGQPGTLALCACTHVATVLQQHASLDTLQSLLWRTMCAERQQARAQTGLRLAGHSVIHVIIGIICAQRTGEQAHGLLHIRGSLVQCVAPAGSESVASIRPWVAAGTRLALRLRCWAALPPFSADLALPATCSSSCTSAAANALVCADHASSTLFVELMGPRRPHSSGHVHVAPIGTPPSCRTKLSGPLCAPGLSP
jgi:hypothetical protein